jgi:hypothetical protein
MACESFGSSSRKKTKQFFFAFLSSTDTSLYRFFLSNRFYLLSSFIFIQRPWLRFHQNSMVFSGISRTPAFFRRNARILRLKMTLGTERALEEVTRP